MPLRRWRALLVPSILVSALWGGCSADPVRLGDMTELGSTLTSVPEGGVDASDGAMCIGTECPAPYATCLLPGKPAYKCGTDLAHDNENCGACGNACGSWDLLHMKSRCVSGRCEPECVNTRDLFATDWRDCNHLIDDGCEIDIQTDGLNCGACGNVCPPGTLCTFGKCGCPEGQIACPFVNRLLCVDPMTDDFNCNGCGNACNGRAPADACATRPADTVYGCVAGKCERLKCEQGKFDCDGDLATLGCASNGCEIGVDSTDRKHCGGCNIECKPDEDCVLQGSFIVCAKSCASQGTTLCPDTQCHDLLSEIQHCGFCGNECPEAGPHQQRACRMGVCAVVCEAGYADCNSDQSDGCETNLAIHPAHCGACGNTCDVGAGQPCIEGKCLMTACDPGGGSR